MSTRSSSPENDIFSSSIIPERENKIATTTSTTFGGLLSEPLLLHEDLKDGCGGQLWPAGMTLAKYMLKYHQDLRDKTIIELGAGGGLVGLAVAKGCSLSVNRKLIITDQIPMLSLMQRNIVLNELDNSVNAAIYNWGAPMPTEIISSLFKAEEDSTHYPDIVLAADCVYFEPAFPLLLRTLHDVIGPGTICYFCFKKRRKADMKFIRDLKKSFRVEDIDYAWQAEDRRNTLFLYAVTLKASQPRDDTLIACDK